MPRRTHPSSPVGRVAFRGLVVALGAVLLLAGCGSGSESADETVPAAPTTSEGTAADSTTEPDSDDLDSEVPDLCSLFTAEDFEALTGETAGAPESEGQVGVIRGTCTISAETGFPLVLIAAYDESSRESTLSLVDAEPVDDLGVEAHWDDTLGIVVPLEGRDWYLQVMVTGGGADRDASIQAAQVALDHLAG